MTQTDHGTIQYRDELIRKMIHLCSLSFPIIYYFISRYDAILILSGFTIFSLTIELWRYFSPKAGEIFYNLFGFLLREHEMDKKKKNLSGATYVFLSALLSVIIFPKVIFLTAFTILIISDTSAALIGRRYGKHQFLAKSLEGTIAFFVSAVIVVFVTPKIMYVPAEYLIGILAAALGAIAENISYGLADDNLTIPLTVGGVIWICYLIFYPNVPLILLNVPQ
ncbi:MAG: dolichol kinase [Ignavibacteriaceae bacterium]|nr:dolichol kinase [Ignavibacteriaceae bacterium]